MNTSRISNFLFFIKGELIKKKRSGFFWMAFIFGLFIPVGTFIAQLIEPPIYKPGLPFNAFEKSLEGIVSPVASFFLVILILLNASKIAQFDHKNGGWQLMDLLPVRKSSVFFGKFFLVLVSNAVLVFTFIITLIILKAVSIQLIDIPSEMNTEIPWTYIAVLFLKIMCASFMLTAFQYVLSVLLPSYIWSLFIGLVLFISSTIIGGFDIFYPFNPIQIIDHTAANTFGGQLNNWFLYTEKFSLVAGFFILLIGFCWYRSKGFYRAFLKNNLTRFVSIFVVTLFFTGSYLYLKPSMQEAHQQTIIAGTVESDYNIRFAILVRPTIEDTIAVIPIENGNFYFKTAKDLPLASYNLRFQNYFVSKLVMGTNDSIYADIRFQNGGLETKLSGTRNAENYRKNNEFAWDYTKYQIEEGQNLERYDNLQEDLLDLVQDELANIKSFRSVDNFTYRNDFKEIIEKEVILEHLTLKEKLEKNVKAKFPDKKIAWSEGWEAMENRIDLDDIQLLDNAKYIDYLTLLILKKDTTEIAESTKVLNGFKKLPNGDFKDKILYSKLMTALEDANTKDERDALATYFTDIQTPRFRLYLNNLYQNLLRLSRTNPAAEILASNLENQQVKLSDLKGKWVMIDFWATWCGPCLYESPYFEKMALKYKNENVAFVALSLDQRKDKWETDAKSKSKIVKQWHANDLQKTNFDYSIQGIPRFVMIDPEGNFYQSKMTRPSDAAFEMILRKALGLEDLE
uniref:redoxin domain-containing protein n=3 Tax=Flavobacterium sp. TaxID=239 RepID=UPI00404AA402